MATSNRSPFDSGTHFQIVRSASPVHVDGFKLNEPTGVVLCTMCWRSHKNIDKIPHEPDCPQKDVHSRWWRRTHD